MSGLGIESSQNAVVCGGGPDQHQLVQNRRDCSSTRQPLDGDLFLHRLELRVPGDECSLALLGQRGGKGVGQAEVEAGFEVRRYAAASVARMDWVDGASKARSVWVRTAPFSSARGSTLQ